MSTFHPGQSRIYCLQFVVQSLEWLPSSQSMKSSLSNGGGPSDMVIDKLGLKFGEQSVTLMHNLRFDKDGAVSNVRFGKICFVEEDQLGFEIVAKYGGSTARTGISFITFEEKKNCSVLQGNFVLKNSSRIPVLLINCIASRHLLKNLGRSLETVNSGTQTSLPPRLSDAVCQTKATKKANSSVQTSKILQRNAWTLDNVGRNDVGTQTDLNVGVHFDDFNISVAEQRKALLKMVVLMMTKVAEKIRVQKDTNASNVVEVAETVVDLKAAKQFGELRKRQIEQMRERLRAMTVKREEALAAANERLHPIDPSSGSDSKSAPKHRGNNESSKGLVKSAQCSKGDDISVDIRSQGSGIRGSSRQQAPLSIKKSPILSPSVNTVNDETQKISLKEVAQSPGPSNSNSARSSVPSALYSSRSESGLQSIAEIISPIKTPEKSPEIVSPVLPKPNNSLLMPGFNQDSNVSPKIRPPNVNPFMFPATLATPKATESEKEKSENTASESSTRKTSNSSTKSESTKSSTASSSTQSSSSESQTESSSESSESESTSSSTASKSSEASDSSTPRPPEPVKKSSKSAKKMPSPPSSASSTFGGGSIATVDSIAEELPSGSDNSVYDTVEALKSVSSISSAVSEIGELAQSQNLSPVSRYLRRGSKRSPLDYKREKPLHTDSVSSYAPSEM